MFGSGRVGRRAGRQERSRADGSEREQKAEIIKSTIGRVGQWQGKGTGVTDMNRQMYVCRQTLRQTVMELFGSLLRQTHWALYFPDTKCWPSFIGCDSHCRAKKQSPAEPSLAFSFGDKTVPPLTKKGFSATLLSLFKNFTREGCDIFALLRSSSKWIWQNNSSGRIYGIRRSFTYGLHEFQRVREAWPS